MTARLPDNDWLDHPASHAVMDALEAEGGTDCARFVGGCVRNTLIGRAAHDIDIATRLTPERVMAAASAAGIKVVPTGLAHGTVTLIVDRRPFEVTTLRRDVETDGRRATVAFTEDWAEDAARRDFRLNALYADRTGGLYDPTGQGAADALAGRVIFVGEAEQRIREDALRILRFFRFFAAYGRGRPDATGLAACAALAGTVQALSAERVSTELLKLLAAPDPREAVRAMQAAGVLTQVLPGHAPLPVFEAMVGISDEPTLRLSALLPADVEAVRATAVRLRLSKAMGEQLAAAVDDGSVSDDLTPAQARAVLYRIDRTAFLDRLARLRTQGGAAGALDDLAALAEAWTPPTLPVGGRQVAALGVAPGPETGRILKAFEAEWIADDFPATGHGERLARLAGRITGPGETR